MENNLLDFGNTAAGETAESKALWERMLRWKKSVAVLGTVLSAVVFIGAVFIFIDSIHHLNNYYEWFAELGEDDYYVRQKRAEVGIFGGAALAVLAVLVVFIYTIVNTNKAKGYPNKITLENALPALSQGWAVIGIGLSVGLLSAAVPVGYSIYVSLQPRNIDIMETTSFAPTPVVDSVSTITNVEPMFIEEPGNGAGPPPPAPEETVEEVTEHNNNK